MSATKKQVEICDEEKRKRNRDNFCSRFSFQHFCLSIFPRMLRINVMCCVCLSTSCHDRIYVTIEINQCDWERERKRKRWHLRSSSPFNSRRAPQRMSQRESRLSCLIEIELFSTLLRFYDFEIIPRGWFLGSVTEQQQRKNRRQHALDTAKKNEEKSRRMLISNLDVRAANRISELFFNQQIRSCCFHHWK